MSCVVEPGRLLLSGRCDIGPPLGRCICGVSSVEVAPAFKEEAEVGRRPGVVAAHTPPPCRLSAIEIALLVEQNPEVERGIAIPPRAPRARTPPPRQRTHGADTAARPG